MAQDLLAQLAAGEAKFADVIAYIDSRYTHTPTAFKMASKIIRLQKTRAAPKSFLCTTQWSGSGTDLKPVC